MLSKFEVDMPRRSPLPSPGLGGSHIASPSTLPLLAISGIGQHRGLGSVEKCVPGSRVLSHKVIQLCGKSDVNSNATPLTSNSEKKNN